MVLQWIEQILRHGAWGVRWRGGIDRARIARRAVQGHSSRDFNHSIREDTTTMTPAMQMGSPMMNQPMPMMGGMPMPMQPMMGMGGMPMQMPMMQMPMPMMGGMMGMP